jgi:hypothetical protein
MTSRLDGRWFVRITPRDKTVFSRFAGNLSSVKNVEMLTQIGLPLRGHKSEDAGYMTFESWGEPKREIT